MRNDRSQSDETIQERQPILKGRMSHAVRRASGWGAVSGTALSVLGLVQGGIAASHLPSPSIDTLDRNASAYSSTYKDMDEGLREVEEGIGIKSASAVGLVLTAKRKPKKKT